ncbi:hypothetical protein [Agreia sp. COWG]|uniref:hypothetical protein n=1 Tax=Agreia sp. COWG TaxID=2773266 RepID=UPI00192580D9|nr:hypothetical protein [Agreia sp. COWG]
MTEKTYTAVYLDGPLEGQTEERAFIDGKHDERFPTLGAVGGLESTFWYAAGATEELDGHLSVQYSFDAADSDPTVGTGDIGDDH